MAAQVTEAHRTSLQISQQERRCVVHTSIMD